MSRCGTASYKIIPDIDGFRYQFFCDLSGARVCTTTAVFTDQTEHSLEVAWEKEGRRFFNRCEKCGKWIADVMFNADVHECVACAPWEDLPHYCSGCGKKIAENQKVCPKCGTKLIYEGGVQHV